MDTNGSDMMLLITISRLRFEQALAAYEADVAATIEAMGSTISIVRSGGVGVKEEHERTLKQIAVWRRMAEVTLEVDVLIDTKLFLELEEWL